MYKFKLLLKDGDSIKNTYYSLTSIPVRENTEIIKFKKFLTCNKKYMDKFDDYEFVNCITITQNDKEFYDHDLFNTLIKNDTIIIECDTKFVYHNVNENIKKLKEAVDSKEEKNSIVPQNFYRSMSISLSSESSLSNEDETNSLPEKDEQIEYKDIDEILKENNETLVLFQRDNIQTLMNIYRDNTTDFIEFIDYISKGNFNKIENDNITYPDVMLESIITTFKQFNTFSKKDIQEALNKYKGNLDLLIASLYNR